MISLLALTFALHAEDWKWQSPAEQRRSAREYQMQVKRSNDEAFKAFADEHQAKLDINNGRDYASNSWVQGVRRFTGRPVNYAWSQYTRNRNGRWVPDKAAITYTDAGVYCRTDKAWVTHCFDPNGAALFSGRMSN